MIIDPTRTKLAAYSCLTFVLFVIRCFRKKNFVDIAEVWDIIVSCGGTVLAISLLIKAFDPQIAELLKEDIIALGIASIAQLIASISLEVKSDLCFLIKAFNKSKKEIEPIENKDEPQNKI